MAGHHLQRETKQISIHLEPQHHHPQLNVLFIILFLQQSICALSHVFVLNSHLLLLVIVSR